MGCDYCIHRKVCKEINEVGVPMMNLLIKAFPAINFGIARAATMYTIASLCSHYCTDEEKEISITIVSGDFPERG